MVPDGIGQYLVDVKVSKAIADYEKPPPSLGEYASKNFKVLGQERFIANLCLFALPDYHSLRTVRGSPVRGAM
jgi:hypothetical protein